jgi:hypothetical protein
MDPHDITDDMVRRFARRYYNLDLSPWQAELAAAILRNDPPMRLMAISRGRGVGRATIKRVVEGIRNDLEALDDV